MVNAINASDDHTEEVIAVPHEQLHTSAARMAKEVCKSDRLHRTVWLMPARFAGLASTNDSRRLFKESISEDRSPKEAWSENAKFVDIETAGTDFTTFDVVSVRATCNIRHLEDFSEDYGENHQLK